MKALKKTCARGLSAGVRRRWLCSGQRTLLSAAPGGVTCLITTAEGEILVQVDPEKAPVTAANFLRYVEAGLYDGTHVLPRRDPRTTSPGTRCSIEVIQGGDVAEEKCFPPIVHETTAMTGLHHLDGTVSMARAEPGTASCSFFICVGDQPELDFGGRRNPDGQGFAAFGRVLQGMEVVRRIQKLDQEKQLLKKPVAIISIKNPGRAVEK